MPPKGKQSKAQKLAAKINAQASSKEAATPSEDTPTANGGAAEVVGESPTIGDRTCTGVLASTQMSRDIKIINFSLSYFGRVLVHDTTIELNFGRRYGLIGSNGSGKSTLLRVLGYREVPIPEHIDIFLLDKEIDPSERTALESTCDIVQDEIIRLEKVAEALTETDPESDVLVDIYERLDALEPQTLEKRAGELLHGLGFSKKMMTKMTKDLSGGWRMRVALARALLLQPSLLLLDEPTNHLDLEACVWLEEHLKTYPRCLVMVSHSQDFLNGVCTNIMLLNRKTQLEYYSGNYDQFIQTKKELEVNQMKRYDKEQDDIKHLKSFIASCGTYSNLVRQAKSKQKIIDKMEAAGLVEKVEKDPVFVFNFPACDKLAPPVMAFQNVSFSYSGDPKDDLYRNVEFGIDCDSRVALVGPNGVGKSTLLKLMVNQISPTQGMVRTHSHLRIGRYHQHLADQLDMTQSALDWLRSEFPKMPQDLETWRSIVGRFGITGACQTVPMSQLSDGQKSRVIFAWLAQQSPNMLLLDEPTNHLDIECIDSLANAINAFEGGVVLVSHDFRLIDQVAKEIWVCSNKNVKPWNKDIRAYKEHLKASW